MARMTGGQLAAIRLRHPPPPEVFVESGTFHGKTTRLAREQFREVHTIELHPVWYAEAVRDLLPLGIRCYPGNSADLIPVLARSLHVPVCWYLDAHWFGRVPDVAGQAEGLPLWAELEAIAGRDQPDILVVDDAPDFGTDSPTPEWRDVSLERIASYFPGYREACLMGEQAVVYRSPLGGVA